MNSILTLAHQYATLKGTKMIAHRTDGDHITFVLESGPKLTLSASQLQHAIADLPGKPDSVLINTADGVDQTEATAAGKALAKRRRSRE